MSLSKLRVLIVFGYEKMTWKYKAICMKIDLDANMLFV